MTSVYRTRHSSISYCKQPTHLGGPFLDNPQQFSESAGGSRVTITPSPGIVDLDTSYVGNLVECVSATNRANIGRRAKIRAAASGAGTFTIDALPANVSAGDVFQLLRTPDGTAVLTNVGAAGTLIAAGRTEANDYWDGTAAEGGYYVEVQNADNHARSYHPLVTNWVLATATLSVSPNHATNSVVGDLCRLVKHPDVLNAALVVPEIPELVRESLTGSYGRERGEQGIRAASGVYEMPFRGPGIGRAGLKSDLYDWLDCVFVPTAMASTIEVDAGSGLVTLQYAAGTPVNGVCALSPNGEAFMIEQLNAGATSFGVSPNLTTVPASGTICTGGYTFTESATTRKALTVYQWDGNHVETELYGGVPSFKISFAKGEFTKIEASVTFADWYRRYLDVSGGTDPAEREWFPRLPTNQALMSKDVRLVFSDAIDFPVTSGTIELGPELEEDVNLAAHNETNGQQVVQVRVRGTFTCRLNATTEPILTEVINRGVQRMAVQIGRVGGHPGVLFFWADKVSIASAPITDDGGQLSLEIAWEVVRDETGLAAGMPPWALYIG